MIESKKTAVLTDYYYPAKKGGGPLRSIFLLNENIDNLQIITSKKDVDGSKLNKDQFLNNVIYTDIINLLLIVFDYDKIYLNSLFSPRNCFVYFLNLTRKKQLIIAPRGELYLDNIHAKKWFLKKIIIKLINILSNIIIWHFTSIDEYESAKKIVKVYHYKIIPNLNDFQCNYPIKIKTIDFLFVGRVVKKKRLHLALKAFSDLPKKTSLILCVIIEDQKYWSECLCIINEFKDRVSIKYNLNYSELKDYYQKSKYLLVPSINENHGHVIFEALNNNCLPIISKTISYSNHSQKRIKIDFNAKNCLIKFYRLNSESYLETLKTEQQNASKFLSIDKSILAYNKLL